jgi:uncharacterized protein (TIGR00369 family)
MTTTKLSTDAAQDILRSNFAPWVQALKLTVRHTSHDSATLSMPPDANINRTGGIVCGQALMALADTAMVIALCATVGEFRGYPTVDVHSTFIKASSNADIIAVATVLRMGKTMAFAEARIYGEVAERPLIANMVGSYVVPQTV